MVTYGLPYRGIFLVALIPGLAAAGAMAFLVLDVHRPQVPERRLWGDLRKLPKGFLYYILVVGVFGLGQFAPTLLILRVSQLLTPFYSTAQVSQMAIGLYVLFNIVQAATAYLWGSLSRQAGSIKLLGVSYFAFALAALGFSLADARIGILVGLFALAGFAVGGIEAMEPTAAAELLPADYRGTGFGALGAANGIGDFLSSTLVGALWAGFGAAAGFGFAALFNLASVVLLISMSRLFKR
jgi:MFS family permease